MRCHYSIEPIVVLLRFRSNNMSHQYAQVKFRVVPANHEWLKEQAKKNRRSLTAELNFILDEKRLRADQSGALEMQTT